MTRPYYAYRDKNNPRWQIINSTVKNAKKQGDQNVYFVDMGNELYDMGLSDEIAVDGCHPNDLGFHFMAKILEEYFEKLL